MSAGGAAGISGGEVDGRPAAARVTPRQVRCCSDEIVLAAHMPALLALSGRLEIEEGRRIEGKGGAVSSQASACLPSWASNCCCCDAGISRK